ncbi:hypothetical protein GCM10009120_44360 [Sphingobacterium siyangense subsp. cladoniae]|uniref:hypothetical protein n=1 Tax=Sphingobacterium siyangense TaxID=459529 RepID=UPI0031FA47BB
MENLTEKESKVYYAIQSGFAIIDTIVNATELSKPAVTSIAGSLIKKGVISKSEGGTFSIIAPVPESSGDKDPGTAPQNNPETNEHIVAGNDLANNPDLLAAGTVKGDKIELPEKDPRIQADKPTLIIPYYKAAAHSSELKLALRTWSKYFPDINVVVVGDCEDWFSDHVIHVEHSGHQIIKDCAGCQAPQLEQHPQADSTHKLMTAIAVLNLSGPIILSNDDIFILRDITIQDIEMAKYHGDLKDAANGKPSRYNEAQINTCLALQVAGFETVRYGTHTPVLIDAEKSLEVIEQYGAVEKGLLFTSLYFNTFKPAGDPVKISGGKNDPVLASVYRTGIEPHVLSEVRNQRVFMNCNDEGFPSVRDLLRKEFGQKCKYEN